MSKTIEIVSAQGHREVVPLWKLPQIVSEEVNAKRSAIAVIRAAEEAHKEAERQAIAAQAASAAAEEQSINAPMDLAKPAEL